MFQDGPTPGQPHDRWSHAQASPSPRVAPLPSSDTCHHMPHCRDWYMQHHPMGPQNGSFVLVSSPHPLSQVLLKLPPKLPSPSI